MVDTRHPFTVRLDAARHEWMRRRSFDRRISMQRIVEEAIDLLRSSPEWGETMDEEDAQ